MRNTANHPSGKYLQETPEQTARREAADQRAIERLRAKDAANAEAWRKAQESPEAMRAYIRRRVAEGR